MKTNNSNKGMKNNSMKINHVFDKSSNSFETLTLNKLDFGKIENPEVAITATEKINIPINMELDGIKLSLEINSEFSATTASTVLAQQELSKLSREEAKFNKDLFMEGLGELGQAIMTAYPVIKNEIKSQQEECDKRSEAYNKELEEQRKQSQLDCDFENWKRDLERYLEVEDELNAELAEGKEMSYEVKNAKKWAKSQRRMYLLGLIDDERIVSALKSLEII